MAAAADPAAIVFRALAPIAIVAAAMVAAGIVGPAPPASAAPAAAPSAGQSAGQSAGDKTHVGDALRDFVSQPPTPGRRLWAQVQVPGQPPSAATETPPAAGGPPAARTAGAPPAGALDTVGATPPVPRPEPLRRDDAARTTDAPAAGGPDAAAPPPRAGTNAAAPPPLVGTDDRASRHSPAATRGTAGAADLQAERPAPADRPMPFGNPTPADVPDSTDAPASAEAPASTEAPDLSEASASTDTPAPTEAAASTDDPATTEAPLPGGRPASAGDDSAADDPTRLPIHSQLRESDFDFAACRLELARLGAVYTLAAPVAGDHRDCGIDRPIDVTQALAGVALQGGAVMRCDTARALAWWMRDFVIPAAGRLPGAPRPVSLTLGSTYQCRQTIGASTTTLSEHGLGNAIDIASFGFDDGTTLAVGGAKPGSPGEAFLLAVRWAACLDFATVLGPGSNAAHDGHLHLDIKARKGGYRVCE